MAKSGNTSALGTRSDRSTATRKALVDAAIRTLQEAGFAGASARAIAARAGCNQALVFYHYGSVVNLLLAALDQVSEQRRSRYESRVVEASSIAELVEVAATIFNEDLEGGHMKVLAELIAGSSSTPGLAEAVGECIGPWRTFAADAVRTALATTPLAGVINADAVGHGMVALYLGLEMLAQLDDDPASGRALFEHASALATLSSGLLNGGTT